MFDSTHELALIVLLLMIILELPGWSNYIGNPEINFKGAKIYVTMAWTFLLVYLLLRVLGWS